VPAWVRLLVALPSLLAAGKWRPCVLEPLCPHCRRALEISIRAVFPRRSSRGGNTWRPVGAALGLISHAVAPSLHCPCQISEPTNHPLPWATSHHPTSSPARLTTIDSVFQPPFWRVIDFFLFPPNLMCVFLSTAPIPLFDQYTGVRVLEG
jgi:hypothetical protein